MTRKWKAILATSAACACAVSAGAARANTTQAGCQAYGAFIEQTAQTLNTPSTPGGGGAFISAIATSSPGALADTGTYLKQQTC
jgi:hypothetical protein